jgi:O-antigen ligase
MSNTATLKPTDRWQVADPSALIAKAAVWLAAAILTIGLVSFRPFQPTGAIVDGVAPSGGDLVNQLGFGLLGAASLGGMLCLAQPRRLAVLASPWWILMLIMLGLSVAWSPDPNGTFRAALFTVIAMVAMAATLVLPRDADGMATVFATAALAVLIICYLGVLFLPSVAIHSADAIESEHAGFWRGSFTHKNIAGPIMAFLSFVGFYLFRRGWKWIGGAIFVLAMLFLAHTGSKTTAGLVPAAILVVAGPSLIGMRRLTVLLFFLAIAVTGVATVGTVLIPPLKAYVLENLPDLTYTGRRALWEFSSELIANRPWTGYGYESVWGTPVVMDEIPPFDRDWDIRGIVNGHNGYLDVAVTMGLPAMIVTIFALLIVPVNDYMHVPHKRENVFLADLFMMILFFGALNAFLESFFFRRAEPVWLMVFLAAFGMRVVARYPLASPATH